MSVPQITGVQLSGPSAGPLLLGSSPGTSATALWSASAAVLGERFHVVACDLPGHGRNTEPVSAGFTMGKFTAGVLAFADRVLTERGEPGGRLYQWTQRRRDQGDLLQTAIYCGVPDANTAFRIAQVALADEETTAEDDHR